MVKTSTVKIGKRQVMVRELTLREVRDLMLTPPREIVEGVASLLAACTDITTEELMDYAPSELQPLIDTILEINADFFAQAEMLEETAVSALMRGKILRISMLAYVPSSPPATE